MYVKAILNIISTVQYARYSTVPCLSLPPLSVRCPHCAGTFLALQWGEGRATDVASIGSLAAPGIHLGFPARCKTEARIAGVWGQSTALVSAESQRQ